MRYLNVHILTSLAYANPNRDEVGAPKTAEMGGATRGRMSSQSRKRAGKVLFETQSSADHSSRSRITPAIVAARALVLLNAAGVESSDEIIAKVEAQALAALGKLTSNKDKGAKAAPKKRGAAAKTAEPVDSDDLPGEDSAAADTLIWLAEAEIESYARKIAENHASAADIPIDLVASTGSLTIACFGRMFANKPELQIEAAVQVAHAITTHAMITEVDYFTAVDDLKTVDKGAGHIGQNLFGGGTYYQYMCLDRRQLRGNWADIDAEGAIQRLQALLLSLFVALPTGRQATAAHHCLPVLVTLVESNHPTNLVQAFETPVQPEEDGGYINPSIDRLAAAERAAREMVPSWFGRTWSTGTAMAPVKSSLEELAAAGAAWARQQ